MTEQDYVLLCIGAKEKGLSEMKKLRLLAWSAYIAPNQDPLKMAKTIERFMPLDDEITELQPIPLEQLIQWDKKFRGLA